MDFGDDQPRKKTTAKKAPKKAAAQPASGFGAPSGLFGGNNNDGGFGGGGGFGAPAAAAGGLLGATKKVAASKKNFDASEIGGIQKPQKTVIVKHKVVHTTRNPGMRYVPATWDPKELTSLSLVMQAAKENDTNATANTTDAAEEAPTATAGCNKSDTASEKAESVKTTTASATVASSTTTGAALKSEFDSLQIVADMRSEGGVAESHTAVTEQPTIAPAAATLSMTSARSPPMPPQMARSTFGGNSGGGGGFGASASPFGSAPRNVVDLNY